MFIECRYSATPEKDLDKRIASYSDMIADTRKSAGFEVINNGRDETVYTAYVRADGDLYGLMAKALRPVQLPEGRMRKLIVVSVGYERDVVERLLSDFTQGIGLEATNEAKTHECACIADILDRIMKKVQAGK